MKKLNITFCSFPDFSGNAKSLYEYMKDKYDFNYIWVVTTDNMYNSLKDKEIDVYKLGTKEYYNYIKKANVIFSTHANITDDKPERCLYIELWHGISSKHIGFLSDNISQSDEKWYKEIRKKIDYFIIPSDFWKVIFATRFNVEYSRVLALGYPKLDYYLNSDSKYNLEMILNINLNNYKKIIYYMPTFRNGCGRKKESDYNTENVINIQKYDENKLNKYLEDNGYLLCIKKHPSEETSLNVVESENIKIITDDMLLEKSISINEIINAADLLITDYSSLGIEFIFLNKPVIYLINDIEQYNINRGITFDNYEFWMPGYRVKKIDELMNAINNSFSKKYIYKNEVAEKRKLWFGNLKNGGCENICNFLFENDQINKNVEYYKDIEDVLKEEIVKRDKMIDERSLIIQNQNIELNNIYNSKGWKLLEKLRKIKNKIKR